MTPLRTIQTILAIGMVTSAFIGFMAGRTWERQKPVKWEYERTMDGGWNVLTCEAPR